MNIKDLDKNFIVNSYSRFDVLPMRGKGATAIDIDNKEYIDFGSGIGVNSLGYSDDEWVSAVSRQAGKIQHTSNLYYNEPSALLAADIVKYSGLKKALFCNSGAEANECALKIARKYSFDKYGPNRNKVLSLVNSFHGRTVATLSLTGQDVFHNYFYPFVGEHYYVEPDIDKIQSYINDGFCAVFIELVQGEGGVVSLDNEFVKKLADMCNNYDVLLIIDEVQTGIGRTGKLFCYEHYGILPDIVTLAKGLGGGLPIGACVTGDKCAEVLHPGEHGTTFGGNPIVAAGAKTVLDKITTRGFLENVNRLSQIIIEYLSNIEAVKSISGKGLMLGLELKHNISAREVAENCIEHGLLILTAKNKLRLLPPLVITDKELYKGLNILKQVLDSYN